MKTIILALEIIIDPGPSPLPTPVTYF